MFHINHLLKDLCVMSTSVISYYGGLQWGFSSTHRKWRKNVKNLKWRGLFYISSNFLMFFWIKYLISMIIKVLFQCQRSSDVITQFSLKFNISNDSTKCVIPSWLVFISLLVIGCVGNFWRDKWSEHLAPFMLLYLS